MTVVGNGSAGTTPQPGMQVPAENVAARVANTANLPPSEFQAAMLRELSATQGQSVERRGGSAQRFRAASEGIRPQSNLPAPTLTGIRPKMTPERHAGAKMFVRDIGRALDFSMSSQQVFAEFLKLNVENPADDPETHSALYEACSNLRKVALEEARAKMEEAYEAQRQAEESAQYAQSLGTLAMVTIIVASVILTAVTYGAFAPIAAPLIAGCMGAILAAGTMSATANLKAQQAAIKAQEIQVDAEESELEADKMQHSIDREADIIETLMELRNRFCNSAIKMLQESGVTQMTALKKTAARA